MHSGAFKTLLGPGLSSNYDIQFVPWLVSLVGAYFVCGHIDDKYLSCRQHFINNDANIQLWGVGST